MAEPEDPALAGDLAAVAAENGGAGSLAEDLRDLAEDAQTLVEAELAYQSARAAYVWNGTRGVMTWLLVAAACAFFAMVALVVGLLLALVPLIGVWAALGAVAVGLALIAWAALAVGLSKFARVRAQALAADPVAPAKGMAPPEPLGPPTPPELAA